MDESIAPIFPYQYAHARRVSCDTFGGIGSPTVNSGGTTSYEMNSASYGWWLAGTLYNYNDPDQMVLEGFTSNENKSRVTSAAIQGYMFDGDDLTDSAAPALAQKWLTNSAINGLVGLNLHFRPVDATPIRIPHRCWWRSRATPTMWPYSTTTATIRWRRASIWLMPG